MSFQVDLSYKRLLMILVIINMMTTTIYANGISLQIEIMNGEMELNTNGINIFKNYF